MHRIKEVWARALHNNLFIALEVLCHNLDQSLHLLNQISSLSGFKTSMISKSQLRREQNLQPTHSDLQRPFLTDYLNKIKHRLNQIYSKHLLPRSISNLHNNSSSLSKPPLSSFLQQPSLLLSCINNSSSHHRQPHFKSPSAPSPPLYWHHLL